MLRLPAIALTCVLVSSLRNLPLALLLLRLLWMLLLHTSLARWRAGQADGGEGDQRNIQAAGKDKFLQPVLFTARLAHLPLTAVSPPPPALPLQCSLCVQQAETLQEFDLQNCSEENPCCIHAENTTRYLGSLMGGEYPTLRHCLRCGKKRPMVKGG